jgi:DNA-binding response OmpR family regulator
MQTPLPPTSSPTSNPPVLIVEDNEGCAQTLADTLESLGHPCHLAPSGEAALAILEQHHASLHCVILDLGLPGMQGDAFHAVATRRWPGLRIILCTGEHEANVRARHPRLHWLGFLRKPYAMDELRATLTTLVPRSPRSPRSWRQTN